MSRFTICRLLLAVATIGTGYFAQAGQLITPVASPNWGTIAPPSSGSGTYTLSATSGMVTSTGTGFAFNNGAAGSYLVVGLPLRSVSCSASIGTFSNSGISVISTYLNGTTGLISGVLSTLGVFTLNIGGVLSISSSATSGSFTATVTVTVNYS